MCKAEDLLTATTILLITDAFLTSTLGETSASCREGHNAGSALIHLYNQISDFPDGMIKLARSSDAFASLGSNKKERRSPPVAGFG